MEKVTLSVSLVNAILQYLGNQPYAQVFQIVEALQKEANENKQSEPTPPTE